MFQTRIRVVSWILLYSFTLSVISPAYSQEWADESSETPAPAPGWEAPQPSASPAPGPSSRGSDEESLVQNAVIEGVQLSSEPSDKPDEKIVSCYFIFRDKPSSYFYEIKVREKKLIFEFNDTRVGAAPVPSAAEPPIRGFTIEQRKVDVNKEVRGLKPEWHDMIRVTFDLEQVPDVHVNDEYSIISFSYKWTNNPQKVAQYTVKDKSPAVILWSTAGLGGVGLGILAYFLMKKEEGPAPLEPLPLSDLPQHKQ